MKSALINCSLLAIALAIVFTSSGCLNNYCDALDTDSVILIVPTSIPQFPRPNSGSCSVPVDGPAPEFYAGPWDPDQSQLEAAHASFNLLLDCTNPDCGTGGTISPVYTSGADAQMTGSTATIFERFNEFGPVGFGISGVIYRSSCNRLPCSLCSEQLYSDIWIADPITSSVIAGGGGVNIDARMMFFSLDCNCGA